MSVVDETLAVLKRARQRSSSCLVAYSGGKDSKVVLDLCIRTFDRVEAFHMFSVPGLECVQVELEWAIRQYGINIRQYPHWGLIAAIKAGLFCDLPLAVDELPDIRVRDIYTLAEADSGIRLIAHGAKRSDSRWRRWNLAQTAEYDDMLYPIVGWSKFDVLAYLKGRGIPLPSSSGRNATGIDLTTPSLLWLWRTYPEDFKRLCEMFPYAEAVVWRYKFHGISE